jgi:hypothetical protein
MRCIWLWFLCGFVATFCLLAALLNAYVMLPSGTAVARVKLWQYYLNEWPRALSPRPTMLRPESSSGGALLTNTLEHLAVAVIGGVIVAAVAWWVQRRAAGRN